jgi:formylglycine-generating enzyme required for sulfatase activity
MSLCRRALFLVLSTLVAAPSLVRADAPQAAGAHVPPGAPVARGPVPGQSFTLTDLEMPLRWVLPGAFVMGLDSPPGNEHTLDETPSTSVTFTRGYWLAIHEVTYAQYRRFVEATGYKTFGERDGKGIVVVTKGRSFDPATTWRNALGEEPRKPVVGLSWEDAVAFTAWLNERERGRLPAGYEYRLPSEAEHEHACLAGGREHGAPAQRTTEPLAVDALPANGWGFKGLAGNVWEYTRGVYTDRLPGGRRVNYRGPAEGDKIVKRGGSRCQERDWMPKHRPASHLGFRVALAPRWESLRE